VINIVEGIIPLLVEKYPNVSIFRVQGAVFLQGDKGLAP